MHLQWWERTLCAVNFSIAGITACKPRQWKGGKVQTAEAFSTVSYFICDTQLEPWKIYNMNCPNTNKNIGSFIVQDQVS